MRQRETVEFMNLCMVCQGSRVLVQRREKRDWPGITFPGGHVEPGESFADAVIREVWEETGLTVAAPQLCGVKDWCRAGVRYVVFLYRAEQFSGVLRSSDEGEVFWVEREDLSHLPEAVADMGDVLRVMEEDTLSEFFYRIEKDRWQPSLK